LSGAVSSHTINTTIHITASDRDKLDSITGSIGTMAYEDASSYSSATEVNTALGNKADASDLSTLSGTVTAHTADTDIHITSAERTEWNAKLDASAYTPIEVDQVIDSGTSASTDAVSTSAVYEFLTENYYTKDETDDGDEVISASLNDLNTRKLDASAYTPVQVDQVIDSGTSASTDAVSTSAVYGFVTSYTPSITVDQVLDDTTSASTNPVSSKAVYDAVTDNELVWTNAYVALSGAVDTISGSVDTHKANTNIHLLQIVSAVTVSSDMSNVTCPNSITGASNNGAQALIIYENDGYTTDYTITVSTSYKTPDGNQLVLTCPANGYCEVSYVNINGTIYVRGI
jgi:hypothetical protein